MAGAGTGRFAAPGSIPRPYGRAETPCVCGRCTLVKRRSPWTKRRTPCRRTRACRSWASSSCRGDSRHNPRRRRPARRGQAAGRDHVHAGGGHSLVGHRRRPAHPAPPVHPPAVAAAEIAHKRQGRAALRPPAPQIARCAVAADAPSYVSRSPKVRAMCPAPYGRTLRTPCSGWRARCRCRSQSGFRSASRRSARLPVPGRRRGRCRAPSCLR